LQTLTPISKSTKIDIVHDYGYRDVLGGNQKAAEVMKSGLSSVDTILVAWEHKNIQPLAEAMGAKDVPAWNDDDFDSVYTLTFSDDGQTVESFKIGAEEFTSTAVVVENFKVFEDGSAETMTVCRNCTRSDGCYGDDDSRTFNIIPGDCTSPKASFPDDLDLWGEFDFVDVCNEHLLVRTFFASKDGSCQVETDEYKLEYNTCLGPFGPDTPWGVFSCV